jgi:hypothetical protein
MTRWVRNRPSRHEEAMAGLAALGVGAAVGLGVYYLARLFFSREALPDPVPEHREGAGDRLPTSAAKRLLEPRS